jgi:guanylate kinase
MNFGLLIVVSGPAGVGKGTVLSLVRQKNSDVVFSVSATSRHPRPGEIDGVNYFFVSRPQFERMIQENKLLEWVEYCGNYYGTPKEYVEDHGWLYFMQKYCTITSSLSPSLTHKNDAYI